MAVDPLRGAGDPQQRVAGDRTHELFEAHARMVYGLCRALLRDPHEAEDATQATFISAYGSLLRGGSVREPAAWLATIARNECATRARARMREPLPLLESDLGHSPEPQTELDRHAVVEGLQEAIADLPERQREAVVLRDLYGLGYAEVGAALGMSVASVESLLFRARRTLRTRLRPLSGGALAVPFGVREAIAQALPAFSSSTSLGGGSASGAVGIGLLSKLAGGPAAVKAAAGVAAAIAAGSLAVTGVERGASKRHHDVAQQRVVAVSPRDPSVKERGLAPVDFDRSAGGSTGGREQHCSERWRRRCRHRGDYRIPGRPEDRSRRPVDRGRNGHPKPGGAQDESGAGSADTSGKVGTPTIGSSDDSGSSGGASDSVGGTSWFARSRIRGRTRFTRMSSRSETPMKGSHTSITATAGRAPRRGSSSRTTRAPEKEAARRRTGRARTHPRRTSTVARRAIRTMPTSTPRGRSPRRAERHGRR